MVSCSCFSRAGDNRASSFEQIYPLNLDDDTLKTRKTRGSRKFWEKLDEKNASTVNVLMKKELSRDDSNGYT